MKKRFFATILCLALLCTVAVPVAGGDYGISTCDFFEDVYYN